MEVGGGWNTDAGVVLVAVDVSNEISSHAVEWAVQKAVRPNDRLILLAFFRPFLPPKASSSSSSIFKLRPLSMAENGCNSLSLSGLNCNIVLANHANPKTLKFINPMPTSTPIEENDDEHKGVEEARHKNQCRRSIKRTPISAGTSTPVASARILENTSTIGRAMPVTVKQLPTPPPLCSFCKHKAPEHSKPPRRFSREEVEEATNGYIDANFLGEGGFGSVYRGVLKDGQVVAVKRHRAAGLQGATEFCTEVEVLSCVQHRNLVKLLGYCVEEEWLLIYEYACNGSLDKQLHGNSGHVVIEWKHRQKVAVGSARGLRYLHEDCRVGCIIHRDFRPKNILLTHDFEPMVGDFGLARWQVKDQSAEETRIIGALGYLAPEYLQTGKITEKTDVYAYGVMLMELITGVKALELNKREWQKNLHKLVNSPLENAFAHELIDSRLEGRYDARETECMMHVAALCISTDPDMRPCMSKVLRMLEEDVP